MTATLQRVFAACISLLLLSCSSSGNIEPPAPLTDIVQAIQLRNLWTVDTDAAEANVAPDLRPLLLGRQLLTVDVEGRVTSIDADKGKINWTSPTGVRAFAGLGGRGALVVAGSVDGDVVAFDLREDGLGRRWSVQLNGEIRAAPAVDDERVYVRTVAGRLSAISLADGRTQWSVTRRVPALSLTGNSTPLIYGNLVIVGSDDGKITAFDAGNGETVWETVVSHPVGRTEIERLVDIDGNFLERDGVIYVSSYQGRLAAIQAISGNQLWSRQFSNYLAMAIDDEAIYLSGDMSHIWSIDRRSGNAFWKQEALHGRKITAPELIGNRLVVGDFAGYVHWIDREDGRLVGRIRPSEARYVSQPLAWRDHLLLIDTEGRLSSITAP